MFGRHKRAVLAGIVITQNNHLNALMDNILIKLTIIFHRNPGDLLKQVITLGVIDHQPFQPASKILLGCESRLAKIAYSHPALESFNNFADLIDNDRIVRIRYDIIVQVRRTINNRLSKHYRHGLGGKLMPCSPLVSNDPLFFVYPVKRLVAAAQTEQHHIKTDRLLKIVEIQIRI